jgi:tetratricopeptide (TPR) repeat protein
LVGQDQQRSNEKVQKAEKLKDEGDTFKAAGEYAKAVKKYIESYITSKEYELLHSIAKIYDEKLQDPGNAVVNYDLLLKEGKRDHLFDEKEDLQKSIEKRIEVLKKSVEHHDVGLGMLDSNKLYQEALSEFEKSQEIAKNYKNLEPMGKCSENLKNNEKSIEYYNELLEYIKKYPEQFTEIDIEQRIERKINSIESGGSSQPRSGEQTDNVREGQNADKGKSSQEKTQGTKSNDSKEKNKDPGKQNASAPKTPSQPQRGATQRSTRRTSRTRPTTSKKKPEVKPPFNLKVSYTFKRVKMSGHYEVDLRHRIREERIMVMSGNIGGLYQQYGEDKSFFSTVSLDDPTFQERTIEVILDGQNFEDFKNYINSVSVMLKKERWGKPATTGEVKFFDEQFAEKGNRLTFIYGREGEGSTEWLDYEYKPKWSFYGGIEWEGDWIKTSDSMITLSPVVYYRSVQIAMDKDNIEENSIKAVAFQIKHQIFGKEILKEVIIDHEKGDPLEAEYRYLHEDGKLDYQYKIIWLLKDGREIHSDWMEKETPIIYAYFTE